MTNKEQFSQIVDAFLDLERSGKFEEDDSNTLFLMLNKLGDLLDIESSERRLDKSKMPISNSRFIAWIKNVIFPQITRDNEVSNLYEDSFTTRVNIEMHPNAVDVEERWAKATDEYYISYGRGYNQKQKKKKYLLIRTFSNKELSSTEIKKKATFEDYMKILRTVFDKHYNQRMAEPQKYPEYSIELNKQIRIAEEKRAEEQRKIENERNREIDISLQKENNVRRETARWLEACFKYNKDSRIINVKKNSGNFDLLSNLRIPAIFIIDDIKFVLKDNGKTGELVSEFNKNFGSKEKWLPSPIEEFSLLDTFTKIKICLDNLPAKINKDVHYVYKNDLWPEPNYEQLRAQGVESRSAYILKILWDAIPEKSNPIENGDQYYKQMVEIIKRNYGVPTTFDVYTGISAYQKLEQDILKIIPEIENKNNTFLFNQARFEYLSLWINMVVSAEFHWTIGNLKSVSNKYSSGGLYKAYYSAEGDWSWANINEGAND